MLSTEEENGYDKMQEVREDLQACKRTRRVCIIIGAAMMALAVIGLAVLIALIMGGGK